MGSWFHSMLNLLGTWSSGNMSFPIGKWRLGLLISFGFSYLLLLLSSISFLKTKFCAGINIGGTGSSSWLQNDMVSKDDGGGDEDGDAWIVFISSSIAALCSRTFKEVAFLYILHKTMSCIVCQKINTSTA